MNNFGLSDTTFFDWAVALFVFIILWVIRDTCRGIEKNWSRGGYYRYAAAPLQIVIGIILTHNLLRILLEYL